MKGRGHRAAGVAGGRNQHIEFATARAGQPCKRRGEKARTKILECRGRTVKELEHRQFCRTIEQNEWRRKVERLLGNGGQLPRKRVPLHKGCEHALAKRRKSRRFGLQL